MSHPSAHKHPDATAPEDALVCPRCDLRLPRGPTAPSHCPKDGALLLRSADMAASKFDPMLGRTFGDRFTVVAKLGAGSMGAVYRARQANIHRDVALKILRSDKAMDEASKARFLREARANSVLVSPHTVTVFDFGESESGELYMVMELLDGESLGQRLARDKRLGPTEAVDLACQALRSLAEAHAKGIVHRDLKPDNLFYAKVVNASGIAEEIVKVLDFGIAKMFGENAGPMNAIETQAGTVFGTPRYMSPEQAQAKPLDARSDLYSLGVILYHVLTGRPPFTDDDAIIVMARHIKSQPKPISEACPDARVPPELERVVMRAMSKKADDRPANADAMAAELLRSLESMSGITSGVRSSLGRSYHSVRPPAMAAPPSADSLELVVPKRNRALSLGVFAFLLLAAGVGIVLLVALRSTTTKQDPIAIPASALQSSTSAPATDSATATAATTASTAALDVTALPEASHAAPMASGHHGRLPHPPHSGGHPASTAVTSATAPATASTRYGILE